MGTVKLRLALTCVLVCAAPAAAQQDPVPREFVNVLWLLNEFRGDRETLHIGTVPEPLASLVRADDERVIGAVQRGRSLTAAFALRGDAAAVERAWQDRIAQAGWTRAVVPQDRRPRGFVSSRPMSRPESFCSPDDEGMLRLSTIDAPGDETYVLVQYTSGPLREECGAAPPTYTRGGMFDRLPWLPPPPGAIVIGGGSGSSGDDISQDATLHSELSPVALITHYGEHMREQGWTAVEQAGGEYVALGAWRRTDDGMQLFAWLSATVIADSTRALHIQVRTVAGS